MYIGVFVNVCNIVLDLDGVSCICYIMLFYELHSCVCVCGGMYLVSFVCSLLKIVLNMLVKCSCCF